MEIRQRDITNSDIFGSDNLDHADVLLQQEGLWTKPMNSSWVMGLTISYAASIFPFAYLICALIPDDYTLHNGRWEHPLCIIGGSLF